MRERKKEEQSKIAEVRKREAEELFVTFESR